MRSTLQQLPAQVELDVDSNSSREEHYTGDDSAVAHEMRNVKQHLLQDVQSLTKIIVPDPTLHAATVNMCPT